jgi:hypothetical protein
MRPQSVTIGQRPNTVRHAGRGLCLTDYEKRRKAGTLASMAPVGHPELYPPVPPLRETAEQAAERDAHNLAAYLRARRNVGRRPDKSMSRVKSLKGLL